MTAIIETGSYVGSGFTRNIKTGFRPDLVLIKGTASAEIVFWTPTNWCGKSNTLAAVASSETHVKRATASGFTVGAGDGVNKSGDTYHWLAIADNGSGLIGNTSYIGNGIAGLQIQAGPASPLMALIKRDNPQPAIAWPGNVKLDGTGVIASGVSISGGVMTAGTDAAVNDMVPTRPSERGEGHELLTFNAVGGLAEMVSWVGDGTQNRMITSGSYCAAIVYAQDGSVPAIYKTDSMASNAAGTVLASAGLVTDRLLGLLSTGTDTTYNASGVTYSALLLRRNRAAPRSRPGRLPVGPAVVIPGRGQVGYINCGTDDSLKIDGAISIEWAGRLLGGRTGNTSVRGQLLPLIMRSAAGNSGVAGAGGYSWGIGAARFHENFWDGPQFVVIPTNYCDFNSPGVDDDIRTMPWRTGILVPNEDFHLLVTHNGTGRWRLYLNGKLVKQRDIDLTTLTPPRVNIQSGTGHRTVIGARATGASTYGDYARQHFKLARIYARELSAAEVAVRADRVAGLSSGEVLALEEWSASRIENGVIIAAGNPANNGSIVGASVAVL